MNLIANLLHLATEDIYVVPTNYGCDIYVTQPFLQEVSKLLKRSNVSSFAEHFRSPMVKEDGQRFARVFVVTF